MAGTRKCSSTGRKPSAGKRKTAQRKVQTTHRQSKATGDKHRVAGERSGPAKHHGKTVRSSNKKRAAKKGETAAMKPGAKRATKRSVIDPDSPDEIYGEKLSERRRRGESR